MEPQPAEAEAEARLSSRQVTQRLLSGQLPLSLKDDEVCMDPILSVVLCSSC